MMMIREDLQGFKPYRSARSEKVSGRVWLNANESPWPQQDSINRYPQQQPAELIAAMADFYQVKDDQLLVSRGSDEAIDLLIRLCCMPQRDAVMQCSPTFGMYRVCSRIQGIDCIDVPLLEESFQLNSTALLNNYQPRVKLIFLCSPNNPTANLLDEQAISSLCQQLSGQALIVVDEAYVEFSERGSLSRYLDRYDNLVILRTLSKAFALAGARIGALLAHREIISWLVKILPPYPLPTPSIALAQERFSTAALAAMAQRVVITQRERQRLTQALTALPIIEKVWPSQANFILVKSHQPLIQELLNDGIVVRSLAEKFSQPLIWRLTIGTPAENSEVIMRLQQKQESNDATV
ncbi:MAG: histidinol-phosphate transaminase [Gammaproteobacteria bacterium]|nr:histidinol-phosphate transaminase [Gammaproteobacteria bacterium]